MKKPEASDLLIPILISLVVLLVSSLIARSLEQLTTRQFILGTVATLCVFLVLVGFVVWFQNNSHREELRGVLAQLRAVIPPSDFPWLYTDAELAKVESEAKGDSIWIVSPDLVNVTQKDVIADAVRKNIKRRITYTYIVPKSYDIDGVLPGLERLFRAHPGQLNLVRVPEDEFRLLSVTHYAIFNVSMMDGGTPEAFLELPVTDATGKRVRGYWIKVSKEAASGLIGRFRQVVDKYGTNRSAK